MLTPSTGSERPPEGLVVYGADWCPDVGRSRTLLDGSGVPYRYIDLERDAEATSYVRRLQHGRRRIPTVVRSDGEHVVEPTDAELLGFLGVGTPDASQPAEADER